MVRSSVPPALSSVLRPLCLSAALRPWVACASCCAYVQSAAEPPWQPGETQQTSDLKPRYVGTVGGERAPLAQAGFCSQSPLFCTGPDSRPGAVLRQSLWLCSGPARVWLHMNLLFAEFPGSSTAAARPLPSSARGIQKIKTESWTCNLVPEFIWAFCSQ